MCLLIDPQPKHLCKQLCDWRRMRARPISLRRFSFTGDIAITIMLWNNSKSQRAHCRTAPTFFYSALRLSDDLAAGPKARATLSRRASLIHAIFEFDLK